MAFFLSVLTCNDTERVCVVEWDPQEPEPFYQPTGQERTPMPAGEERGRVVYCIDHGNFFYISEFKPNQSFIPQDGDGDIGITTPMCKC